MNNRKYKSKRKVNKSGGWCFFWLSLSLVLSVAVIVKDLL